MRKIAAATLSKTVKKLIAEAAVNLNPDVLAALRQVHKEEKSPLAKQVLDEIVRNVKVAQDDRLPLCQDTGFAIVYVHVGESAAVNGNIYAAVNEGVAEGYKDLRKSIVGHPFHRKNTKDNTPAVVYVNQIPGDKVKVGVLLKGGGAENCSFQKMFLPTSSKEEVENFIVEQIKQNAAKACPPIIVGVGIGGTFDFAPHLAKMALLRPVGKPSEDAKTAAMEKNLLKKINKLGIGPMGLGGKTTALAVNIEFAPCHIASLPVAVNIQCHSHRYKETEL